MPPSKASPKTDSPMLRRRQPLPCPYPGSEDRTLSTQTRRWRRKTQPTDHPSWIVSWRGICRMGLGACWARLATIVTTPPRGGGPNFLRHVARRASVWRPAQPVTLKVPVAIVATSSQSSTLTLHLVSVARESPNSNLSSFLEAIVSYYQLPNQ